MRIVHMRYIALLHNHLLLMINEHIRMGKGTQLENELRLEYGYTLIFTFILITNILKFALNHLTSHTRNRISLLVDGA